MNKFVIAAVLVAAVVITGATYNFLGEKAGLHDMTNTAKTSEPQIIPDVPKDAIPPLTSPKYQSISQADWIKDDDLVLGANFNGDARAYPIKIMNWHEIVNETIGDAQVVVTYCPLCRSGIIFDRRVGGQLLTFGNTGALYESAMVMYDQETQSYWYQAAGRAIKGPLDGQELTVLPSLMTSWGEWKSLHPQTKILSRNTGFTRNYDTDPYIGYDSPNSKPGFPVSRLDPRLPNKELIVGVKVNGVAKAYPVNAAKATTIKDELEGQEIEIVGSSDGKSAQVFFVNEGIRQPAPVVSEFWFSWALSHPETLIYSK